MRGRKRTARGDEMAAMRAAGVSYRKIAAKFGVTEQVVYRAYKLRGGQTGAPGMPRKKENDEAYRLREEGMTYREVAERIGSTPGAVYQAVRHRKQLDDQPKPE